MADAVGVLSKAGLGARATLDAHRILTAFTTGIVMNELTESDPRGLEMILAGMERP